MQNLKWELRIGRILYSLGPVLSIFCSSPHNTQSLASLPSHPIKRPPLLRHRKRAVSLNPAIGALQSPHDFYPRPHTPGSAHDNA